MNTVIQEALDRMNEGFSCSQAVFSSLCEKFDIKKEDAYKIAAGFGGGYAHCGEVCGAVSGAIMLIGLKYGKVKKEDTISKEKTYEVVREYINEFKSIFGSINCNELVNFDLSNKEELEKARESGIFKDICPRLVKASIEIVERKI